MWDRADHPRFLLKLPFLFEVAVLVLFNVVDSSNRARDAMSSSFKKRLEDDKISARAVASVVVRILRSGISKIP